MTILQSIVLGIIQGVTEFLPVSSSAHLVLVPYWLGWQIPAQQVFVFDVLVQLGTLLAVILYFRQDLARMVLAAVSGLRHGQPWQEADSRLAWCVVLATIPAGLAGLLLKDQVEAAFQAPILTAALLLGTALLLWLGDRYGKQDLSLQGLRALDALVVGLFQALSIFPGISRSGSTLSGGQLRGLDRPAAARFSFLMSIPIMAAAGAVAFLDMLVIPNLASFLPVMAAGFLTAAIVGYLAIRWLLDYLRRHTLLPFAVYCVLVFLLTSLVAILKG